MKPDLRYKAFFYCLMGILLIILYLAVFGT